MFRGPGAALAVALSVGALAAGGAEGDRDAFAPPDAAAGVCELRGSDRSRTSSLRCVACHDGSTGPSVDFNMRPGANFGMSHPVEVDYGGAAARDPGHYVPPGQLPPEVPLVDGKVTCTSCHDGASDDPKHVAIPHRLCQACHRL